MSRIITTKVRLSYPKLFEPDTNDQGKKVYSCALVIEDNAEGQKLVDSLEAIAQEVGKAKFGAKYDQLRKSPSFKWAVRYDVDGKYSNALAFVNARSYDVRPGIVSIYPGPDGKPKAITDPNEIYAGAYVRASISCYAYDRPDSKGVAFSLGNLQKLADGDRLDGRSKAEDEFEADASAAADFDDL